MKSSNVMSLMSLRMSRNGKISNRANSLVKIFSEGEERRK